MPPWLTHALLIGVAAALASALSTPVAINLSHRFGLVARPGGRRQHTGDIPRLGGLPLLAGLVVGWALAAWLAPLTNPDDQRRILGVVIGTVLIALFGLLDDRFDLPPLPQFALQTIPALIAIATTVFIERFTNPLNGQLVVLPLWVVIPVTWFWILGMINTVNWLDGLDGLVTGVSLIAALLFAAHMNSLGQPELALYAVALAGACLGLLPFNFYPARIFLGGTGPLILGYALATLSIIAPARYAIALLVLAVPITDTAWQIFDRWRRGRSPMSGDRGHLHFRLLDAGFTQRQIVLAYWAFCAVFGTLSLVLDSPLAKFLILLSVALILVTVLGFLAFGGRAQHHRRQPEDDRGHAE